MTVVLLLSCSQVTVKDEIVYANKGMLGAVGLHTLTNDQCEVTFQEWMSLLRTNPMLCVSVSAFGDVKKELEQLCSVCNCCSVDMTVAIDQFMTNVQKSESGENTNENDNSRTCGSSLRRN